MVGKCVVFGCSNSRNVEKDISMHKIPSESFWCPFLTSQLRKNQISDGLIINLFNPAKVTTFPSCHVQCCLRVHERFLLCKIMETLRNRNGNGNENTYHVDWSTSCTMVRTTSDKQNSRTFQGEKLVFKDQCLFSIYT